MTTYNDRFTAAVRAELPASFAVEPVGHGTNRVIAVHEGGEHLSIAPPSGRDKRAPIDPADVRRQIGYAAAELRRISMHFKPEFKDAARALLDALAPEAVPA